MLLLETRLLNTTNISWSPNKQFLQKLVERSMATNAPVPLEESTDIQPVSIPGTDQAGEPATVEPDAPSSDRRKRRRAEVN